MNADRIMLMTARVCALAILLSVAPSAFADVTGGWADINGTVTGGAGGPTVIVTAMVFGDPVAPAVVAVTVIVAV